MSVADWLDPFQMAGIGIVGYLGLWFFTWRYGRFAAHPARIRLGRLPVRSCRVQGGRVSFDPAADRRASWARAGLLGAALGLVIMAGFLFSF